MPTSEGNLQCLHQCMREVPQVGVCCGAVVSDDTEEGGQELDYLQRLHQCMCHFRPVGAVAEPAAQHAIFNDFTRLGGLQRMHHELRPGSSLANGCWALATRLLRSMGLDFDL